MKCLSTRALVILLGVLLILGCAGCSSKDSGAVSSGSEGNITDGSSEDENPAGSGLGAAYSIEFVSADPTTIALKGTGGPHRPEVSSLIFKVVDGCGQPTPMQMVEFRISPGTDGLSLSAPNPVSDSEGLVHIIVKAGRVPVTGVKIQAALAADPSIYVTSDELSVSIGLPEQDKISLSVETLNPEAWNYDNEEVKVTFLAADHFNNFVPDGTVVHFRAEGGLIDEFGTTKDGVCTVTWLSGGRRPENGRVTILAFCAGEESFTDYNGNGLFDEEDQFDPDNDDLGEPFCDANENKSFDPGETYWDSNCNRRFNGGNGIYNGVLCSDAAEAAGSCTKDLVYVQASAVLVMSGSDPNITFWSRSEENDTRSEEDNTLFMLKSVDLAGGTSQTVWISITDINHNPMPRGTTVSVKTTTGKIDGDNSFTVPNTKTGEPFPVTLESTTDGPTSGMLTVDVTTPNGHKSTGAITVINNGETVGEEPAEDASSIEFVSATPSTIALKSTGGPPRSEVSCLVFKVVDKRGKPVPKQVINFQLSKEVGGLSLSDSNAISDLNGKVQVFVKSGTMPTHIRVLATLAANPSISTVSDELIISTGLPDQDSVSISADILNPEAWSYNDEVVNVTFQAADHFNNFVPDGTVVYFTTEGGSIVGSSTITDGVCKATWRSGNPRPVNGRVTILAFCIGEESFIDYNGNGLFDGDTNGNKLCDEGEDCFDPDTDLAEPFRDDNENGYFDPGEEYWDYNNNRKFDGTPDGKYNGSLCSDAAQEADLCTKELVYVKPQPLVLTMSGSTANINISPATIDLRGGKTSQEVEISIVDLHENPMPAGTSVTVETTNGKIIPPSSFTIPSTNLRGGAGYNPYIVTLVPSEDDLTSGTLTVTVTTPHKHQTIKQITVKDDPVNKGGGPA